MADLSPERTLAEIQNEYQLSCAAAGHTNYLLGIAKANLNKLEAEMASLTSKLSNLNAEADALAGKAKAKAQELAAEAKVKAQQLESEAQSKFGAALDKVEEEVKKVL